MGFLIGLALLAAFAAALMDPYGRKLLATMAMVVVVLIVGGIVLVKSVNAAWSAHEQHENDWNALGDPIPDDPPKAVPAAVAVRSPAEPQPAPSPPPRQEP